ncbi:MAG: hypothetical protein IPH07_28145 [Deltaproteobacteria bacterium]|nr:hypothetical protein [Deltaproteobacteria bacterium]MBK8234047.1 hypothetical protein [Deltaproteobacteria bacterium]MBK8714771.1 hypothetical protein [Deltaproteobacteria bacterium]MBP7289554.1 hypothetical protein [Nannocystaceae bacterium]
MKFASSPTWVLIPCLLVAACDGGKKTEPAAKQDDSKASDADLDKRLAERKAKREADEKAKAAADEAKAKAIEAVCVLPPGKKPEKSLDKACAAVGPAYDRFMKRFYEGETLAKWESAKGTQLPMVIAQCTKTASVEVGACIVHALDSAPVELKEDQSAIIRGCIDAFGPGSAHGATAVAGGAVPKKPR